MPVVAISPYHLTTRETPALVAVQIADHAVTLLPTPPSGRDGALLDRARAESVARETPGYAAFMDAWRWAAGLFREGVVRSTHEGEDAADDVRDAWARIYADRGLAPLRPLMREALYDSDRDYLAAVARDLVRGGPDPAVTIPVSAGLDRFASRHGLLVARPEPASVVQRVEAALARRLFTVVVPALVQAAADRLLEARELFENPLNDLRAAIDRAGRAVRGGLSLDALAAAELREAASAYTAAFDADREEILGPGPADEDVRPVAALVSITAVRLPRDAVLRSSLHASGVYEAAGRGGVAVAPPALEPDIAAEPCVSLVIRRIGG